VFQRDKNEENGPNVGEAVRPMLLHAGARALSIGVCERKGTEIPGSCVSVLVVKVKT
jgi:hypothetical protein